MPAAGTTVRPALGTFLTPQPPHFGKVLQNPAMGTNDVLFDNGAVATAVPDGQLDTITAAPDPTRDLYLGRVVRPIASTGVSVSQEYTGEVVDIFVVGGLVKLLVKLFSTGIYRELADTQVEVVADR